jgi:predicted RND superfamily exporter protein/lauroyl/myristoyl acyltransferase
MAVGKSKNRPILRGLLRAMSQPGLKHPGRWLWLFLLAPVALGLARLHFDVEVFDLLPDSLPAVQGLKIYQQHFANARELIVTLKAASPAQAESAARAIVARLRPQSDLVSSVTWEPPWLEHPEQAAELVGYLWLNQPPELFRELARHLAPNQLPDTLAAAREQLATSLSPEEIARLSYDPFGLMRLPEGAAGATPAFGQGQEMFASSDGKFRIIFVEARDELRNYRDCDRWLAAIKPLVETAAASAAAGDSNGFSVGYTGRPAFVAEIALGMQHDMTVSIGGTAVIIAVLFWLAHRRIKPMLWLLTLLALILGSTLALGGLIFGTINVVSMGFAAILLGLAVDYAVVHYQEALAHPNLSIPQIRHEIAPSIFWAAVTTISAFLVLNFGGLPGLAQLGSLVALGVGLAAIIMIFEFLPPLFPDRREPKNGPVPPSVEAPKETVVPSRRSCGLRLLLTAGLVIFTVATLLCLGWPRIDPSADPLRPRNSPSYAALAQVQKQLSEKSEPLWVILEGRTEADVARNLIEVQSALDRLASNHFVAGFTLPTPLWPRPQFQEANRATARTLAGQRVVLREAAQAGGFAENSLGLTERILDTWQSASATSGVFWPTNEMSRWIFGKFAVRTSTNDYALGLVNVLLDRGSRRDRQLSVIASELPHHDVWLSGWQLLGSQIFSRVKANMWKVLAPMVGLVAVSLWLAFRRPAEILISLGALLLSGLCLLTVMRLAGWSWNLLNLMAIPLVLGTGVDYGIFMQLALRRYNGDLQMAYRSVGRALLLCGGTAIAGFGSLAFSSNAGMASLGEVCAIGVACNMLIAIFLSPVWWHKAQSVNLEIRSSAVPCAPVSPGARVADPVSPPSPPSALYRAELWRLGLTLVRLMPRDLCARLGLTIAGLYWTLAHRRRAIVIENLLPALEGDRAAAGRTGKKLVRQFARKVVDLWRYEAGMPIDELFGPATGWEEFERAKAQKRGVLLLTPHLGNWEFGGPLLSRRGVSLQVVTLAEPGGGFTELRRASRARWDIDTLVIGHDPFAFVEIIRRRGGGATVALLVDRPPASTAVEVELFGRPFAASLAAAELARATGCVLLPVYLPLVGNTYEAHVLPAVLYERATLRDRAARQRLTQQIMRVFEPVIREHLEQWYHFVPVWPKR